MVKAIAEGIKWGERMSREEAIEILKDLWRTKYSTYLETDIRKALEMAIQALEQELSGDLISRQAVFDLIEHYNSDGLGTVFIDHRHGIKFADAINALPSVKQEPPTGHWIAGDGCREVYAMEYECSECGCNVIGGGDFCKWCGAKMD